MSQPTAPSQAPNPLLLQDLATRFMASKLFFAATEVGLFAALSQGPATLAELAERLAIPLRTTRIVTDAMVSLGVVAREGDRYLNTPTAEAFLTGKGPVDFRPLVRMFERLEFPAFRYLVPAIREGFAPQLAAPMSDEEFDVFHKGIEIFTIRSARALLAKYDFSARRRLLDVGGGNGSFMKLLLSAHPELHGTLFDLPNVIDLARQRFAATPLAARISLAEGDVLADDVPTGHDVILVANVIHLLAPEHTELMLRRLREVATAGTELLLLDLWTDATHTQPAVAALMAAEFVIRSSFGDVYSVDEVRAWLAATGWEFRDQRPLGEPLSLIVAGPV